MTAIHTTSWPTEGHGDWVRVEVDASIGDTGDPVHTVSVRLDSHLTVTEARRLIADLQHAVALTEEPQR